MLTHSTMTAAVLSIGTELTRGELVNGNAAWLGGELTALGFEVTEHVTVDDHEARIVDALRRLGASARLVVCTGGLGPTTDDLTAAAVARALGVPLVRDEASLAHVRRRFEALGRPMPPSNAKQADFPEGAEVLPNFEGTAPGFAVTLPARSSGGAGARAFFMPGVPAEMRRMFAEQVAPRIVSLASRATFQVHLRTFGLTESQVGERLAGIEEAEPDVTIGYRASFPEVEVKVLARGGAPASSAPAEGETAPSSAALARPAFAEPPEVRAEATACRVAALVRERLGDVVYGGRDDSYPAVVGRELRQRRLRVALAESCTGGLLGAMLTSEPGASEFLDLSAVAYANEAKTRVLGVPEELLRAHGAVSPEVARAMAEGARALTDADLAVAITGIAGPGGGTPDKPVGTVCFAVARRGAETQALTRRLWGDRDRIRTLACYVAMRSLLRAARGEPLARDGER
jgi:nicotinamide-nucleotide amidase